MKSSQVHQIRILLVTEQKNEKSENKKLLNNLCAVLVRKGKKFRDNVKNLFLLAEA